MVKCGVWSVIHSPQKCLIAMCEHINAVLDWMQKLSVIKKVNTLTNRVSSSAYSWKSNSKLQLHFNPKHLIMPSLKTHHSTPTIRDHRFLCRKQSDSANLIIPVGSAVLSLIGTPVILPHSNQAGTNSFIFLSAWCAHRICSSIK